MIRGHSKYYFSLLKYMKFTLWPIISPIIISVVCMLKKTECPPVWGMGCHVSL